MDEVRISLASDTVPGVLWVPHCTSPLQFYSFPGHAIEKTSLAAQTGDVHPLKVCFAQAPLLYHAGTSRTISFMHSPREYNVDDPVRQGLGSKTELTYLAGMACVKIHEIASVQDRHTHSHQ